MAELEGRAGGGGVREERNVRVSFGPEAREGPSRGGKFRII